MFWQIIYFLNFMTTNLRILLFSVSNLQTNIYSLTAELERSNVVENIEYKLDALKEKRNQCYSAVGFSLIFINKNIALYLDQFFSLKNCFLGVIFNKPSIIFAIL